MKGLRLTKSVTNDSNVDAVRCLLKTVTVAGGGQAADWYLALPRRRSHVFHYSKVVKTRLTFRMHDSNGELI
jgi:hypothetical protein